MGQEERGGGWRGRRQVQRLVPCSEAECRGNPSLERFVQSPDPQAWYVTLIKLLNLMPSSVRRKERVYLG